MPLWVRVFFFLFGLLGVCLVAWNWGLLVGQHYFYARTAMFGPLSVLLIIIALQPEYLKPLPVRPKRLRNRMNWMMLGLLVAGVANFLIMRKIAS